MKSICVYPINEQLTVNVFIAHFLKVFFFPVFQFYSVPLVLEVMVGKNPCYNSMSLWKELSICLVKEGELFYEGGIVINA